MKIICIGRNYLAHAKELNNEVPDEPVIFLKPDTAKIPGKKVFFLPDFSKDVHHELEVVLKISRNGKNIAEKFAHRYFDELSLGIDFTARDMQSKLKAKGLPWELAKAFDGSAPTGKFVPLANYPPVLDFHLNVNGKTVQHGNTQDLIFSFAKIVSFASTYFTLLKGDHIFTGTPAGVGPVKKGDKLEAYLFEEKILDLDVR